MMMSAARLRPSLLQDVARHWPCRAFLAAPWPPLCCMRNLFIALPQMLGVFCKKAQLRAVGKERRLAALVAKDVGCSLTDYRPTVLLLHARLSLRLFPLHSLPKSRSLEVFAASYALSISPKIAFTHAIT